MAIVVEDGTGKSNAVSYVSATDLKAYWLARGVTISDSDAICETWLVRGTEWIDDTYAQVFKGQPVSTTQALQWPRSAGISWGNYKTTDNYYNVWDNKRKRYIATNEIPIDLKNALYQIAKVIKDKDTISGAGEGALSVTGNNIQSETVHDVSVTYTGAGSSGAVFYRAAEQFLTGIIERAVRV